MAELNDGTLSFEARLNLVSKDVQQVQQQLNKIAETGANAGNAVDKSLQDAFSNLNVVLVGSTSAVVGKLNELVSVSQTSATDVKTQLQAIQEQLTKSFNADVPRKHFDEIKEGAERAGEAIDGGLTPMIEKAQKALGALGAGFTLQQVVTQVARTRGEFQQLEVSFETMLGSEEKSAKLMNELVNTAAHTPFDLKGIADGAKQLLAYGFAAEDVNDTLVMLGNVASGLSIPLNDIVYLYGTTMTQGRLFTQDMRQFMGRGIPLADELATMFGKDKDEINKMVTAGKIGFNEVAAAMGNMTAEGGKFYNLMDKQSKTISGLTSNLGDAIDTMMNEIGTKTQDVFAAVIKVGIDAVENYKAVGKAIVELASVIGTYKAIMVTVNLLQMANNKLVAEAAVVMRANAAAGVEMSRAQVLAAAKTNIMTAAQNRFTAALRASLLANPYAILAAGITTMTFVLYKMVTYQTQAEKSMKEMNKASAEASANAQVEISKLDALIGKLKGCKEGTEEYNNTKKEIVDNFGKYDSTLNQENASVLLLKDNYKKLAAAIVSSVKSRAMMNEYNRQMEDIEQQTAQLITKLKKGLVGRFGEELGNELHQKIITGLSLGDVTKEAYAVGRGYATRMDKNTRLINGETKEMKIAVNGLTEDEKRMASAFIFMQEQLFNAFQRAKGLRTELEETFGQKFEVQTDVETGSTTGSGTSGGDDEDEAKKAEEQRKKQIKAYEKAIAEAIWQSEINLAQAQINAMKDGELKTERQLDLNMQKRLHEIDRQREEWREKNQELFGSLELTPEQQKILDDLYSAAHVEFDTDVDEAAKKDNDELQKKLEERLALWRQFAEKQAEITDSYAEKRKAVKDDKTLTESERNERNQELAKNEKLDTDILIAEMGITDKDIADALNGLILTAFQTATSSALSDIKEQILQKQNELNELKEGGITADEEIKVRQLEAQLAALRKAEKRVQTEMDRVDEKGKKAGLNIKDRMGLAADAMYQLNEAITAVRNEFGDFFSDFTNEALDMVQTMLSSTTGVLDALKVTGTATAEALSTAEKSTVILAIIQAAIQVTMAMVKFFSNFTKNARLQDQIDALAEDVERLENAYEKAVFAHRKLVGGDYYRQQLRDVKMLQDALKDIETAIRLTQQQMDNAVTEKGKKKYRDNLVALEEQARNMTEKIAGIYDNFYENVLAVSSKDFASSLTNSLVEAFDEGLRDMSAVFDDAMNDMLKSLISAQMKMELEKLYEPVIERFKNRFGENKSTVTQSDIDAFVRDIESVEKTGQQIADGWRMLYDAIGLNTGDLSASANALQGMTQDTAEELNGRFTALQMSGASIDLKMDRVNTLLQQISASGSVISGSLELAVTLANEQLNVLEDIRTNTSRLAAVERGIATINTQLSTITGQ